MVVEVARSKIETRALYDEYQWVLLDGFINLGLPDKIDSWLSEGLTIYLEPIVSYRAGWRSADSIWEEWTSLLRDGVEPLKKGLEDSDSYWGGALFALMVDVELRRLTQGRMGLENCLRLDLGKMSDASVSAPRHVLTNTAATAEQRRCWRSAINPEPVLTRLAARYLPGAPVDFDALLASLGVHENADKTVTFDENAPLANVRHWLLEGGPGARLDRIPMPVPPD